MLCFQGSFKKEIGIDLLAETYKMLSSPLDISVLVDVWS